MKISALKTSSRREWLRDTARVLLLGGIGGGSAVLVTRNGHLRTAGKAPVLACSECPSLYTCSRQKSVFTGKCAAFCGSDAENFHTKRYLPADGLHSFPVRPRRPSEPSS